MISQNDGSSRLPPQNLEAEQCVLGSMLLDREIIGEVLLLLAEDDFYMPANAEVFRTLISLYDRNAPVDLVLVTNELRSQGRLDSVGGVAALAGLMETVPNSAHALAYARLVRDSGERRRLVDAAQRILRDAYDGTHRPVSELLDQAEQTVFAISHANAEDTTESMATLIKRALVKIDAVQEGDTEATRGLKTHYGQLDRMLNGLAPGGLYVIAGRPSMGKTSFALNILDHVCVRDGVPALLFTLEVGKEQIAENLLCSNARVDAQRLLRGELSNEDYAKVPEAAGRLVNAPLYIDDTPGLTVGRLRAKARRMKARHNIGLIVVDYLQLLALGENAESRQIEISRLSAALKQTARELAVPVITLSQLNRSVEQRADKRPLMGDLRESGSIEQDADAVLLLFREEYYNKEKLDARGKAEVILAKNRNGPTGSIDLFFFPSMMRFENPTFIPEQGPGPPASPAAVNW
ncbi:MAG: replicative DNA helicase [Planctomycetota bacterium]